MSKKKDTFQIKNRGFFPGTLEITKNGEVFPLDGVLGIRIEILPEEPARISFEYLLGEIDIKAREKENVEG